LDNDRIWTPEYVLLMVANFFVAVNFYALFTTAAGYALDVLGVSEAAAGFGAGIFVIGSLFARVFLIRYTTVFGYKKSLLVSTGALVIFTALFFVGNSFALFCAARFFAGVTFGVNSNTLTTMVSYSIPADRKGEGIAWFSMSQSLGMALGPFFSVSIMHSYGYPSIFLFATIVAVGLFIMVLFIKQPKTGGQDAGASPEDLRGGHSALPPEERGIWRVFERNAVNIAIICVVIYMCNSNFMSFGAIAVTESGAANLSSLIFLVNAGAMLVSRPFIGKIFDKDGPNKIIVFGILSFAAGLFLLSRGLTPAFLPAGALIGLGISSIQGASLPIVVTTSPKHRIAIGTATLFFSLDLGGAIGPTVGGKIVEYSNYGMMYTICAALSVICIPLYFGVLAKKLKPGAGTGI